MHVHPQDHQASSDLLPAIAPTMPGEEPELNGLARLVGNGAGPSTVYGCESLSIVFLLIARSFRSSFWVASGIGLCLGDVVMADRLCIYEEELRDLLTYECAITGKRRCPPFQHDVSFAEKRPKKLSCMRMFHLLWFQLVF